MHDGFIVDAHDDVWSKYHGLDRYYCMTDSQQPRRSYPELMSLYGPVRCFEEA